MKKYPLAKPYIGKEEIRAVTKALKSGRLSLGPVCKKFEEEFAKKIGTKYAVAVSSGTAGLHLAMIAAGIKPGDEVITTPFSFVASANCILYVGAKPIFVDIEPATYNIDPSKVEAEITPRTKAILVVHIFGQAADMDPILKLAEKYKLKIIEDACEAVGATYKGKNVGTFGQSAVFAFYPNKQMTTGEGGMIVTNSKHFCQLYSSLRNQGREEDMEWLDHKYLGYNYRLDEMSAALGLVQLKKLDKLIATHRKIASWYNKYLEGYTDLIQPPKIGEYNTHTWFVYVVRIKKRKINRDMIIKLLKNQGISTKPYLPSIHLFKFYAKKYGYRQGDFPISENASQHCLALPFYIGLSTHDIKNIVNQLVNAIKRYKNDL